MTVREKIEKIEKEKLSSRATLSANTKGRTYPEEECPLRTAFQRDRDRIIHSKSFRRLKHKTQVLILPAGDHYRTRMTHTLEVMQIARTIARALFLNEDLTEAIALGHDLGHTPFGHTGEHVLASILEGGFTHYEQSLRVVECLEKNGRGLNLTYEVKDGILKHSKGLGPIFPKEREKLPETMEGMIVRISDIIAYINHDLDDAMRAGIIRLNDLPENILKVIGEKYSERINNMVTDVIRETERRDEFFVYFSERMTETVEYLRNFLNERVYASEHMKKEGEKCYNVLKSLFEYYMSNEEAFERDSGGLRRGVDELKVRIKDFIAGMTDRYALKKYAEIFIPREWKD